MGGILSFFDIDIVLLKLYIEWEEVQTLDICSLYPGLGVPILPVFGFVLLVTSPTLPDSSCILAIISSVLSSPDQVLFFALVLLIFGVLTASVLFANKVIL
jgi:hypothetical protein